MYTIRYEVPYQCLRSTLTGFWEAHNIDVYFQDLYSHIIKLTHDGQSLTLLTNARDFAIQAKDTYQRFIELNNQSGHYNGPQGMIISSQLQKIQMQHVLKNNDIEFFDTPEEATRWLIKLNSLKGLEQRA